MSKEGWIFSEDQRDAVCNGEICPKCLSTDIAYTGCIPDGINATSVMKNGKGIKLINIEENSYE